MNDEKMLICKGMSKSFGPTKAVVDVDFSLGCGEVRGLIGENGSGKSTLCNLITGTLKADKGTMLFQNTPFAPSSLLESKEKGISILLQETGTINGMTVAENIFLGKESQFSAWNTVNRKKMNQAAQKAVDEMGLNVKAAELIDNLSFEDRKLVEVIRAIYDEPQILIVDETTTALSQYGRDKIYAIVEKMKQSGRSVIFITHDLAEVMSICDSVTVLRDGHYIDTVQKENFTEDTIRQLMIGRDLTGNYYRTDDTNLSTNEVVLEVRDVSCGQTLRHIDLQLKKGEILGIGGLTDCGMHDLAKVMFGAIPCDAGEVVLPQSGTKITSPDVAIANRVAYIPKDRDQESIFLSTSIMDNITVVASAKMMVKGLLSKKKEKQIATEGTTALSVKMQGHSQHVKALSGGNKQKVAIAKWIVNNSDILIMDCPTRGIDIGVKSAIYSLMETLIKEKKSIVMISEELPELIGMSDRVLIMKSGRINGTFYREDGLKESEIIKKMI